MSPVCLNLLHDISNNGTYVDYFTQLYTVQCTGSMALSHLKAAWPHYVQPKLWGEGGQLMISSSC